MARSQPKSSTKKIRRQALGKRPQGIEKQRQQLIRKSRRLQEQQLREQASSISPDKIKLQHGDSGGQNQLPSPFPSTTPGASSLNHFAAPQNTGIGNRKRKAEPIIEDIQAQSQVLDEPRQKRLHTGNHTACGSSAALDRISHWVNQSRWPRRDFEPDPNMDRPAPKRSRSSSSQGQSDGGLATPSDQKSRANKSSPYLDPRYENLLELKGSFMKDSQAGILAAEKKFCETLINKKRKPPSDSLFDDRFFRDTFDKIQNENETRVIRDISLLITPSAEILATRGIRMLGCLKESTNAGWNKSIPFEGPRPQPDYSVGFKRGIFSDDQIKKLRLQFDVKTYFAATEKIHFPFLTCEVKCGNQALDIADRQNAHSMTLAVRGVVELYRNVGRAQELHRKVLAFSISHDYRNVSIYGHYPEIDGLDTKYYRSLLKSFNILSENGKDKWAANQFTRNVYDSFVPTHLDRIKSAVDQLCDPTLESFQSTLSTEDTVSSQGMVTTSAPSSQEVGDFKKPAPRRAGGAIAAELRVMVQSLEKNLEQQREEAKQREDQLREESKQQLAQQREESKQQLAQQREESKQRHTELMDLLKEQKELTELLKQQISSKRLPQY